MSEAWTIQEAQDFDASVLAWRRFYCSWHGYSQVERILVYSIGRGRDTSRLIPPAQIRTGAD